MLISKYIILITLFVSIWLFTVGYSLNKCQTIVDRNENYVNVIENHDIPIQNSDSVIDTFKPMFQEQDAWLPSVYNIDYKKKEELNNFFLHLTLDDQQKWSDKK